MKYLSLFVLLLASLAYAQGPPAPYTVSLTWNTSTTVGVTGQNIYRSSWSLPTGPCGTSSKLNTSVLSSTATSFTDATVTAGSAYCYFATAIGPTGESGPSNIVSNIQIPPLPPVNVTASVN